MARVWPIRTNFHNIGDRGESVTVTLKYGVAWNLVSSHWVRCGINEVSSTTKMTDALGVRNSDLFGDMLNPLDHHQT